MNNELKEYQRLQEQSSAMNWLPRIIYLNTYPGLNLHIPQTIIIPFTKKEVVNALVGNFKFLEKYVRIIQPIIKLWGRAFIRTDQTSVKHYFNKSCFYTKEDTEEVILHKLHNLIEFTTLASMPELPFKALLVREYIEPEYRFTAFSGKLPIAKEVRVLVYQGKILTYFPYWFADPIKDWCNMALGSPPPKRLLKKFGIPADWEKQLEELNELSMEDRVYLEGASKDIAKYFPEFWSIDFMKGKDGKWYFIDMARGEVSFIPPKYRGILKKFGLRQII